MPLWGLLTIFFIVLGAAMVGALSYFTGDVLTQFISGSSYIYAVSVASGLVILILLIIAVAFLLLGHWIALPMRRLTRAMRSFAETGKQVSIQAPGGAPRELRQLMQVFAEMSGRLEIARKHDEEVARVKSDFISTAAHQLRTPLTGIRWSLEALEKSQLTEDQKVLIGSASGKSKELVAIVGTLLDISAIESGKYKYQFAPVDVSALLEELARDFAPLSRERKVSLAYVRAEGALPPARADRERIKWVLNNLIENALRYTPTEGSVRLLVELAPRRLLIRVRDTGIGILPQDRSNIFERFFRGSNAISKENEGNGLGLYIARTVATDHGGDLTFEPNGQGPGTTFTLSLPIWE